MASVLFLSFFFFNDTATTEIYTLSLHERSSDLSRNAVPQTFRDLIALVEAGRIDTNPWITHRFDQRDEVADRKSTRLNSSHSQISYAVFCLKKKKHTDHIDKSPLQ